ncbi:hypothetical protein ACFLTN_02720 [Chloroflexota bacterium]
MNKRQWYLILAIALLIVFIGSAISCTATTSIEEAAPPPASTTNTDEPSNPPPEAVDTSPTTGTDTASDEVLIGSDPVSGQSQEIDLSWEQFCLSDQYQVQIAKDPDFTIIVVDTGSFAPASSESPAVYYPAGGRVPASPSAVTPWAVLESGHTYYWRARVLQAATGQVMRSPWSEVKSFTVEAGMPASTPSYGPQPMYPNNGCGSCPVKPASFTWSALKDTTKYRFVLAKDAAMTQVVKETETTTTAYEYDGQLEDGQSYFWRVMALEPVPSDWSATFNFRTEAAPLPPPQPAPKSEPPLWAWVVIATGIALLIAIIVLIIRTRRR